MQRVRHSLQNVLILRNLCSQHASLSIRDLVIDFVKIRDEDIVKLTLYDTCMYMKPATILFLFTLEHCVEHVYFGLCQNMHMISEKFKQFVIYLRSNCITNKCDAEQILRKIYDRESNIECELIAYASDNVVYENSLSHIIYFSRSMKNKLKIRLKIWRF